MYYGDPNKTTVATCLIAALGMFALWIGACMLLFHFL